MTHQWYQALSGHTVAYHPCINANQYYVCVRFVPGDKRAGDYPTGLHQWQAISRVFTSDWWPPGPNAPAPGKYNVVMGYFPTLWCWRGSPGHSIKKTDHHTVDYGILKTASFEKIRLIFSASSVGASAMGQTSGAGFWLISFERVFCYSCGGPNISEHGAKTWT